MSISTLIPIDDILAAKYNIEVWLIDRENFQLYQDTNALFTLDKSQFSFTVEFSKLIFTYWTDNKSESWKVLKYKIKNDFIHFDVYFPFSKKTIKLLLKEISFSLTTPLISSINHRKGYLSYFCNLVKQKFPELKIDKATINNTPKINEQIGVAKLLLNENKLPIIAVAISKSERKDSLIGLLSQALRWLNALNARFKPISIDRLMIFAPSEIVELLAERLTLITKSQTKIELFEIDEIKHKIISVKPFDQGYLALSLAKKIKLSVVKKTKFSQEIDSNVDKQIEWIKSLAPELVEIRPNLKKDRLYLHINGMVFATIYLSQASCIKFKYSEEKMLLTSTNRILLEALVKEIAFYRQNNSPNKQHPYYSALAESWLGAIISRDICRLDPNLLDYFYSQVPVSKEHNKFIDLLAVDNTGQLVIIELKTSEDIELLFQSLDYWLRIEWYRLTEELTHRGYFPNIKLKDEPAKVYLVTPKLRFHKELSALASLVDKKIPLYWIAINDSWRQGLKIESRQKLN